MVIASSSSSAEMAFVDPNAIKDPTKVETNPTLPFNLTLLIRRVDTEIGSLSVLILRLMILLALDEADSLFTEKDLHLS